MFHKKRSKSNLAPNFLKISSPNFIAHVQKITISSSAAKNKTRLRPPKSHGPVDFMGPVTRFHPAIPGPQVSRSIVEDPYLGHTGMILPFKMAVSSNGLQTNWEGCGCCANPYQPGILFRLLLGCKIWNICFFLKHVERQEMSFL